MKAVFSKIKINSNSSYHQVLQIKKMEEEQALSSNQKISENAQNMQRSQGLQGLASPKEGESGGPAGQEGDPGRRLQEAPDGSGPTYSPPKHQPAQEVGGKSNMQGALPKRVIQANEGENYEEFEADATKQLPDDPQGIHAIGQAIEAKSYAAHGREEGAVEPQHKVAAEAGRIERPISHDPKLQELNRIYRPVASASATGQHKGSSTILNQRANAQSQSSGLGPGALGQRKASHSKTIRPAPPKSKSILAKSSNQASSTKQTQLLEDAKHIYKATSKAQYVQFSSKGQLHDEKLSNQSYKSQVEFKESPQRLPAKGAGGATNVAAQHPQLDVHSSKNSAINSDLNELAVRNELVKPETPLPDGQAQDGKRNLLNANDEEAKHLQLMNTTRNGKNWTALEKPQDVPKGPALAAKSLLDDEAIRKGNENDARTELNQKAAEHIQSLDELEGKQQLYQEYFEKTDYETNQSYYDGAHQVIEEKSESKVEDNQKQAEDANLIQSIVQDTEKILTETEFDVCAWGSTSAYNAACQKANLLQSGKLRPLPDGCLVIVAGNTSNIWNQVQKFKTDANSEHPFDDYSSLIAAQIQRVFQDEDRKVTAKFAHETSHDELVSFQRLVQALSFGEGALCYFQDDVHLLFHEKYGNWHAWRFALVFEDVYFGAEPQDKGLLAQMARQCQKKQQVKLAISQDEIKQAKSLSVHGQQEVAFTKDTSHIWLQAREIFKLGREYKYPLDMLKYHYSTVPASYFEGKESRQVEGDSQEDDGDRYSDDDFAEPSPKPISHKTPRPDDPTAKVHRIESIQNRQNQPLQNDTTYSLPATEARRTVGNPSAIANNIKSGSPVKSDVQQETACQDIFEKSPPKSKENSEVEQKDCLPSAQQQDVLNFDNSQVRIDKKEQKIFDDHVTHMLYSQPDTDKVNALDKGEVLASSPRVDGEERCDAEVLNSKIEDLFLKRKTNRLLAQHNQYAEYNNLGMAQFTKTNKSNFNTSKQSQRNGLKFQFINKSRQQPKSGTDQSQSHNSMLIRGDQPQNQEAAEHGLNLDDDYLPSAQGISNRAGGGRAGGGRQFYAHQPSNDQGQDAAEPTESEFAAAKSQKNTVDAEAEEGEQGPLFHGSRISSSNHTTRQPQFVNTMRLGNIKYPFGYQKAKAKYAEFEAQMMHLPPAPQTMTIRSPQHANNTIDQIDPLRPLQEQLTQLNTTNVAAPRSSLPPTSKSQGTVGIANPNSQSNSLYNLRKFQSNVRNTKSNYMSRRQKQGQQISVREFLDSQLNKRHRTNFSHQSQLSKSDQSTINHSMKSGLLNNEYKLYKNGAICDTIDNSQAYPPPSSSRSPVYRNRFIPKFHARQQDGPMHDQHRQFLVSNTRMAQDKDQPTVMAGGFMAETVEGREHLKESLLSAEAEGREFAEGEGVGNQGAYLHDLAAATEYGSTQRPPWIAYNRPTINETLQVQDISGLTAEELQDRFRQTYAGISKADIVKKPNKDIFQKIKRNLSNQRKELQDVKAKRLRQRIRDAHELALIQKQFLVAKKQYFRMMDDASLRNYQAWQTRLNMWHVNNQTTNQQNESALSHASGRFDLNLKPSGQLWEMDVLGGGSPQASPSNFAKKQQHKAVIANLGFQRALNNMSLETGAGREGASPLIPPIDSPGKATTITNPDLGDNVQPNMLPKPKRKVGATRMPKYLKPNERQVVNVYSSKFLDHGRSKTRANSKQEQNAFSQKLRNQIIEQSANVADRRTQPQIIEDAYQQQTVNTSETILRTANEDKGQRQGLQTAPADAKRPAVTPWGALSTEKTPPPHAKAEPLSKGPYTGGLSANADKEGLDAASGFSNPTYFQPQHQEPDLEQLPQVSAISERHADGADPRIVTYQLPEHDMTLDFKSNILSSHPDALGQQDPAPVQEFKARLSRRENVGNQGKEQPPSKFITAPRYKAYATKAYLQAGLKQVSGLGNKFARHPVAGSQAYDSRLKEYSGILEFK